MSLVYVTITGQFLDAQDNPLSGTASFVPNTTVYAAGIPVLQPNVPVQAQIVGGVLKNSSGGTLQLLATDNPGLTFEGQTGFVFYTVSLTISGDVLPSWSFFLPHTPSTVDLYALANTPASSGALVNPMSATGDMIDGAASGIPQRLPGNTTTAKQFLTSTGTGSAATAPAWAAIASGDLPAATSGAQGAVQLAGDLGGTAASLQVTGTHLASPLPLAQGGTSAATQQAAINALTGAQSAGRYLRSDGTNAALASIQAGDVPVLNQNTTGTAAGLSSALAIGSGGTGQASQQAAIDALAGAVTSGQYLRGNGTHAVMAAIQAGDVPTLNQSTTGSSASCTGNAATATNLAGGATLPAYLAPAVVPLTFGATISVNAALGNVFTVTLTSSAGTIANPTNPVDGQVIRFRLAQDATGGRTVAWGTAYDWGTGNSAPSLSSTASKVDILAFEYVAALSKWASLAAAVPQGY